MLCAKVWACAWVPDPQHHVHPPALAAPAASAHPPLPKRVRPVGTRVYTTPSRWPTSAPTRPAVSTAAGCYVPPPLVYWPTSALLSYQQPQPRWAAISHHFSPSSSSFLSFTPREKTHNTTIDQTPYEPATREEGGKKLYPPAQLMLRTQ
jgi:hypothetical protein